MARHRKSPRALLMLLTAWSTDGIPLSGLGEDSVTDSWTDPGWTDGKMMLLSHILTMRGSDVASLIEFRPVVKEEIEWRTDGRTTDARKNNVTLAQPYHKGKWCSKFGWIPPSGLGGDRVTDRWKDDGRTEKIMLLLHNLTIRGSDVASLVEFRLVV